MLPVLADARQKVVEGHAVFGCMIAWYNQPNYPGITGGAVPTRDMIHEAVKNALIKDGWTITADPYIIEYEDVILFADLGAERPMAAERAGRKIVDTQEIVRWTR
jgi:hypothetical protein